MDYSDRTAAIRKRRLGRGTASTTATAVNDESEEDCEDECLHRLRSAKELPETSGKVKHRRFD